ncbi:MAG: transposase, partial [Thermodesulfobacteriota bacterium]
LDSAYLLAAVRYVERNPVRANMVKHAWNYQWSSAAYHAGLKERDELITDTDILDEIDDWKMYLSDRDMDLDELRQKTRTGRPIGGEGFILKAEEIAGRCLRPGKAGRPKKN